MSRDFPRAFTPLRSNPAWFAGAVVCCLMSGCHGPEAIAPKAIEEATKRKPQSANILTIAERSWPLTVRCQGNLVADETAVVGAKVPGRVAEIFVEVGDVLEQGDPLVRLEMSDFELQIRRADAQLAEACAAVGQEVNDSAEQLDPKRIPFVVVEKALWEETVESLDRLKRLRQTNSVSESELDRQVSATKVAKARYESALSSVNEKTAMIRSRRVELAQAMQNKEDATIRAPFAGSVTRRHLGAGTFIQPGTPVITIMRINPLRFQGRIPERKATSVQAGQPIRVLVEGESEAILSTVKRINPSLDMASRSLHIEAEIENSRGRYRSGLFAEGSIEVDSGATTLAVEASAVGEFAGVHKVWVVKGDVLEARPIEIGREFRGLWEILSGLKLGETILADYQVGTDGFHEKAPSSE